MFYVVIVNAVKNPRISSLRGATESRPYFAVDLAASVVGWMRSGNSFGFGECRQERVRDEAEIVFEGGKCGGSCGAVG